MFAEPLGFWVLSMLFFLAASYAAYRIGVRIGRRRTLTPLLAQKQEISLQNRRLQDLLEESEAARSNMESALGGSEERAAKLANMFQLRGDFFANISHDFRTPLTLVIDPLETALKGGYGPLHSVLEHRLRIALRSARQMLRLINQLLDLAKVDAGSLRLFVVEQDLAALVKRVVDRYDSEAERRKVTLMLSCDDEMPMVFGDTDKLERIVANLISNALEATPAGGKVLVRCGRSDDSADLDETVEISVRDTGIGIPEEKQSMIFDRFFQVGRPSAEYNIGTGLGLAIAREFVELHRGTIEVASVPGFGSTFTVSLPTGRDHFSESDLIASDPSGENAEVSATGPIEELMELGGPTVRQTIEVDADKSIPLILLVDDNADIKDLLRGHLAGTYRIAESSNGLDGLNQARKLTPDLIISDVIMPGMEGIAFCRMIKQDKELQHIPVILLTGLASNEARLEGLQVGVDAYITRPFGSDELLASVENLIMSRRALRERYSQEVVIKPYGAAVPLSERPFIEQVLETIDVHLEDSRFTVGQLARELGVSDTQLKRKLRTLLDEAPVELIRKIRIERAAELLKKRAGNVSDVAFATGFNNLSYFAKCFRERWGVTPSQFLAGEHKEHDAGDVHGTGSE